VRDPSCGNTRVYLELEVRRVLCRCCGEAKRERIDFIAGNPFYTKRFARFVGRRCRSGTIKDVAEEPHLDWQTVKELDKQYMQAQLERAGTPGPKAIGIDEISIRKGRAYRIAASDPVSSTGQALIRRRPIRFGGEDRSETSMNQFYDWLGETAVGRSLKKARGIRPAAMDRWKPFRNAAAKRAPQAAIPFDKFTSCAISTTRSTRCAVPNMPVFKERRGATSWVGSMSCRAIARTWLSMAGSP